jgi:hypothetical protein
MRTQITRTRRRHRQQVGDAIEQAGFRQHECTQADPADRGAASREAAQPFDGRRIGGMGIVRPGTDKQQIDTETTCPVAARRRPDVVHVLQPNAQPPHGRRFAGRVQ